MTNTSTEYTREQKMLRSKANIEVANTIIGQIGGRKFSVITGAKDFLAVRDDADRPGVQFRLPQYPGVKVNRVRVLLDEGTDTYIMEFYRTRGNSNALLASCSDVYCSELASTFEQKTGLLTSLN